MEELELVDTVEMQVFGKKQYFAFHRAKERKKVERTTFPGWNKHPVYSCRAEHYEELTQWMRENQVDEFLLESGLRYVWQVRTNHAWFALRWA